MNTLSYSGKLKKIYSASEVIEFIENYVAEKGLSYELLEEQCILVDFGIETEGIGFSSGAGIERTGGKACCG